LAVISTLAAMIWRFDNLWFVDIVGVVLSEVNDKLKVIGHSLF